MTVSSARRRQVLDICFRAEIVRKLEADGVVIASLDLHSLTAIDAEVTWKVDAFEEGLRLLDGAAAQQADRELLDLAALTPAGNA